MCLWIQYMNPHNDLTRLGIGGLIIKIGVCACFYESNSHFKNYYLTPKIVNAARVICFFKNVTP